MSASMCSGLASDAIRLRPRLRRLSCLMWLLAIVVVVVLPSFVTALTARGPAVVLQLQTGKTSLAHPLHASRNVTLWCAPDNPQVTIQRAWFVRKRDKRRFDAQLSSEKKNATFMLPSPTVVDAGEYTCELDTQHGRLTSQIQVYARPVSVTDDDHFTVKENNEFHLEGERRYVKKGGSVNITCPVFGYPTPGIKWTKDGKPLELSDKVTLDGVAIQITDADYQHAGMYTCEAVNEYTASGKTSKPLIIIERILGVKSELAWIFPLAIIITILVLLIIIIGLCELRKRRQNKQSRYLTQE